MLESPTLDCLWLQTKVLCGRLPLLLVGKSIHIYVLSSKLKSSFDTNLILKTLPCVEISCHVVPWGGRCYQLERAGPPPAPGLSGSVEDKGWVGSGWILVGSDPGWRQRARTGCAPPLPEAAHCPLQGLTRWTGKVYHSPPTPPSICPPGKPWLREGIVDSTAVPIFGDILVESTTFVFVNSANISTNIEKAALSKKLFLCG